MASAQAVEILLTKDKQPRNIKNEQANRKGCFARFRHIGRVLRTS